MTPELQRLLRRVAGWVGGFLAGLALLIALLLWTPPGHRAIAWIVGKATGGTVVVEDLGGALPGSLSAGTVELRDSAGVWLRVTNAHLVWSPFAALNNHFVIHWLTATKVELLRRPLPSNSSSSTTPRIDVDSLSLPEIDIASALIGYRARLAAQGSLHFTSIHVMRADLAITRPGSSDHYTVNGAVQKDVINGTASIAESPDGLFGRIIGFPGLGPVALSARASGDRAANHVAFSLTAGRLSAKGQGQLSLARDRADIDFTASSPAMQLNAGTGWASLAAQGHVHGGFAAPVVNAALHLANLRAGGLAVTMVDAHAEGRSGNIDLSAKADGVRLPGSLSGLFAAAPVELTAHADLNNAAHPVRFTLRHPLVTVEGTARTAAAQNAVLNVSVPSLAPFAAAMGTDIKGRATMKATLARAADRTTFDLTGGIRAEGKSAAARMLGPNAALAFHMVMAGSDILNSRLSLSGAGFDAQADGSYRGGRLAYRINAGLSDLSRLAGALSGTAKLTGSVNGVPARAQIALSGGADMASRGFARQHIALKAAATGLPNPASAQITGTGKFDNANFNLAADWGAAGSGHSAKLSLDWKSLKVRTSLTLPRNGTLNGHVSADAGNLGDISSLANMALAGRLHVTGDLGARNGRQQVRLHLDAAALRVGSVALAKMQVDGMLADAFGASRLNAKLRAEGLDAAGITGAASAQLTGPLDKLAASVSADLKDPQSRPLRIATKAQMNIGRSRLRLDRFQADWRGQTVKLVKPATFDLAGGAAVDQLRLEAAGGTLQLAGRISSKLSVVARARGIHLSAFQSLVPLPVDGTIDAQADLAGSPSAPMGTITVDGKGLRIGGSAAPGILQARAELGGNAARLNAKFSEKGSGTFTLQGTAPLSAGGSMDLHAAGDADLALLNPLLAANGRQVKGQIALDMAVTGSMAAPQLSGSAALKQTAFQDYTRGLRIHDIAAELKAKDNVIRIAHFAGRAGPGTIAGSGRVDFAAPGWPVDLTITAHNARPIVSDLITASLSGNLTLKGQLRKAMTVSGKLEVPHAEINIPDSYPPQVQTLNIRHRGEKPPPPAPTATALKLDLAVATTGPVIVRGHGVDADLEGRLQLKGSTGAPQIGGGFDMRRGTLAVAGQTLKFTTGKLTFNGNNLQNRLDPVLEFVAETSPGGVTATLTVTGYASAPKITLSSTPQLPQDEILARLLFQQSTKQLTPLQMAEIGQALVSLSGVGNGFNPVASIRGGLGLDRLAVSGGSGTTTGTTVEAGKYVFRNVYVGAKQGLSGGTEAQVQLDITRNLKAQATVDTGSNATATQGTGAQQTGGTVGLSYQFEY